MGREQADFTSDGRRCAAWLYRPGRDGEAPCVVMAHGFSGVREQRLDAYAERFAEAGLAALLFDYRHFGASGGEPRQLLDISRQLADWRAAVAHARTLPGVDPARIALWGSSFSGGHVIRTAADVGGIAAVVAQCPFTDGLRNLPYLGVPTMARLTVAGLRDQLGALAGLPPHTVPAVGPPGSWAVMNTPDAEPGFKALDPEGSTWRNEVAARLALRVGLYRPGRAAARVLCPLLVCVCDEDRVCPPRDAVRAAEAAPRGEARHYPIGHFDIYVGEWFERAVADQTRFLAAHVLAREPAVSPG